MKRGTLLFCAISSTLWPEPAWSSFPAVGSNLVVLGKDSREGELHLFNDAACPIEYSIDVTVTTVPKGNLLHSPRRVLLPPRQTQVVRFLKKGPRHDRPTAGYEVVITKLNGCLEDEAKVRWAVAVPIVVER
jgi:P pilus assembly chaperone PapD